MMPKKLNVLFKNHDKKNYSFITYPDFESILVPENSGKQNSEESYTNKDQKHIACSCGY